MIIGLSLVQTSRKVGFAQRKEKRCCLPSRRGACRGGRWAGERLDLGPCLAPARVPPHAPRSVPCDLDRPQNRRDRRSFWAISPYQCELRLSLCPRRTGERVGAGETPGERRLRYVTLT